MTPDDILDKALHILERDGWHQGSLADCRYDAEQITEDESRYEHWQAMRNAPVCAIGALNRATTGVANGIMQTGEDGPLHRSPLREAAEAAYERLRKAAGLSEYGIPDWNDDENTTREDIVLAFKRARHGEGASA